MDSNSIYHKLIGNSKIEESYKVFQVNDRSCYFGKDREGNVVFMISSSLTKVPPVYQETRSLRFAFNRKCTFTIENKQETKTVHLLTCKEHDPEKVKAFIRLTKAFAQTERDNDQYYLANLFSSLSALFDKSRKVSEIELQGLFSELYTILHFHNIDCDISMCWQSRNLMKFDFTINEKKRLEIKSTIKPSRTHHFKHDQLLSELYDIKIVSVMLRKSDSGLSLGDLIEKIRDIYPDEYLLMIHIESIISHVDKVLLDETIFDIIYLENNLQYYDAASIPHFNEKTPDGVFNAEYDCCLDLTPAITENVILGWIKEG